jgi:hypothetical protein
LIFSDLIKSFTAGGCSLGLDAPSFTIQTRSTKLLNRPDKDALRAMLESQVQEKLQHDPDAVTTYAAKPEPERKPYTSKPTVQDKAFHRELDQMRADAEAGVIHKSVREPMDDGESSLALDDYPGLKEAGSASNQW